MEDDGPRLSVVVPCYNEEEVLGELERRLLQVCHEVVGDDHEIVLVNDGSTDRTWDVMAGMVERHRNVVAVDLSRNFGHQLALTAGLTVARGRRVLIIDADLQDPPELLPVMMSRMDAGADVVIGQRVARAGESRFKVVTARAFYWLLSRVSGVPIPSDAGDFRLVSRRVLDVFLDMPEQFRFVRGMFAWAGFAQELVPFERPERFAGETKYPFRRMLALAIDAITGFSIAPLRLAMRLAATSILLTLLLSGYVLLRFAQGAIIPGWTSTVLIVLVFSSVQLVVLAMIAEYVGRTYVQSQRRPTFIVREVRSGSTGR